jgi:hypothetical protein
VSGFLDAHPEIGLIALNGTTAAKYFKRLQLKSVSVVTTLPSTSAAQGRHVKSVPEKVDCWKNFILRESNP